MSNPFKCANCGGDLNVCMVEYHESFDRDTLQDCEDGQDFENLYKPDHTEVHVSCDMCDNPQLSPEDFRWLSEYVEESNIKLEGGND